MARIKGRIGEIPFIFNALKEVTERRRMIDVLLGDEPADLVLKNVKIVNVLTREIYDGDIAIKDKYVLKIGDCKDLIRTGTRVEDLDGNYAAPGFIDAHMHFESAMLTASEFSRLSIPTGTTTLIADPHEIGNVLGPIGIKALAEECSRLPNHIYLRPPCLTPDCPGLETAGYDITFRDLPEMMEYQGVDGIGEIQGVTPIELVYKRNPEIIDDIIFSTSYARMLEYVVDGNAPELFGSALAAHIISGGTDISCHETATKEEALEKLRYGVHILMREGSTQKNMAECIRVLTEGRLDSRRLIIATDDMLPNDILKTGHMDDCVRKAIARNVDPVEAIQMVTINPATWCNLTMVGVLAPGKYADIVILSDIDKITVKSVFLEGKHIAENRKLLIDIPKYTYPSHVKQTVKRAPLKEEELAIQAKGSKAIVHVIGLVPDQNLTRAEESKLPIIESKIHPSVEKDILSIAVVERHGRTDNIGKAFVTGFGMEKGAIAQSISHDAHNIISLGVNFRDMATAVNHVIKINGGIVVVEGGRVLEYLPLPIAGLMTDELSAHELIDKMEKLTGVVHDELGIKIHGPFMHLSFLSLTTSPKLKITDKGLIDTTNNVVLPPIKEIRN